MAPQEDEGQRSYDETGLTTVGYTLSTAGYGLLRRMLELGAVEGTLGEMALMPELQPLLEGMFVVLAGGDVEVKVTKRGSPDIVKELRQRAAHATEEGNAINKAAGYYVTALP